MGKGKSKSVSQRVVAKPVRPALIASRDTVREYSTMLKHLLAGLVDESIHAALVCGPEFDVGSVVPPTVEVIRHPAFELPLFWWQSRKVLLEELEKFKPTVLHCLCPSKALLTRRLAGQLELPYVLTVNSLQSWFDRFLISSKRCVSIIVPAASIGANVAEICPKFAERIVQINIGTFVSEAIACFSKPGRLVSMVAGHFLDDEGDFENLLDAVKNLAIDGYEFVLVVIVSGRAEKRLRRLISARGLSQIVIVVGRLRFWRDVLAASDIFIRYVSEDAFAPLLLEAMSVGSAVAGCKGGVDDLIVDGQTAVVFDSDDELSIRTTLQQLLDRRELARKLAENAQEHLKENHSVSKMVASVLEVYREAQNASQ